MKITELVRIYDSASKNEGFVNRLKKEFNFNVIEEGDVVYLTRSDKKNYCFKVEVKGRSVVVTPKRGMTTLSERKKLRELAMEYQNEIKSSSSIPQSEIDKLMKDLREKYESDKENGNKFYLSVAYRNLNVDIKEHDKGFSYLVSRVGDPNSIVGNADSYNSLITNLLETINQL